jgi:hypothetical protein
MYFVLSLPFWTHITPDDILNDTEHQFVSGKNPRGVSPTGKVSDDLECGANDVEMHHWRR